MLLHIDWHLVDRGHDLRNDISKYGLDRAVLLVVCVVVVEKRNSVHGPGAWH